VGDYSAQAVINTILSQAFPEDPIVGEEDATELRAPNEASQALRARVVELADDILAQPPLLPPPPPPPPPPPSPDSNSDIGWCEGERAEWGLGKRWGADALLKAIDRGKHAGGLRSGRAFPFSFLPSTFKKKKTLYSCTQVCGHLILSMGRRGSCAAGNTPYVSRC
jgi:3'(2'), 5'-bisphosphate nucleotidase